MQRSAGVEREGVILTKSAVGGYAVTDGAKRYLGNEAGAFLRERFPFTRPAPVLGLPRTFGVGDRLGVAGDGHLRVFQKYDAVPVLAQQSMRELKLTNRTYPDVLDAATFAVFRAGYTGPWGADGDPLKTMDEVRVALGLGFTMITLDCSEHIRPPESRAQVPQDVKDRYLGRAFPLDDGSAVTLTEDSLSQALAVYGEAIRFAKQVWDAFFAPGAGADLEISIDETGVPTSPAQHFFAASELSRLGVGMKTMAPRFVGEFQKGIDYVGDEAAFDREMSVHAAIARRFGYKISVHSGSDKFRVFPSIARYTRGVFHVKTAGTNWLEAMRVAAEKDPGLYRRAHAHALAHFDEARAYYHVSAKAENVPALETLPDAELPGLFGQADARQLIHIAYGLILSRPDLKKALYGLWEREAETYAARLEAHIGRHMEELGVPRRG